MTVAARRSRQPKLLAAGALEGNISSFRLQLAAEGKSPKTIRMYTEAVRWFAAAHLLQETGRTCWEQFCRWWAEEEELPSPMARLRAPVVRDKLIPVFTSGELSKLEKACQGRTFAQRRDYAIIAVFRATGIRLSELAGICYDPGDPLRSDVDLQYREIT